MAMFLNSALATWTTTQALSHKRGIHRMQMNALLRNAYQNELEAARVAWTRKALHESFAHLERALILGQRYFLPHMQVHLYMLRIGWARRDGKEVLGQITRLLLTPLGHLAGRLPLGNTGGANVSAFQPMPIAPELDALLKQDEQ